MTVSLESVGQTIKLAIGTVDDQQPTFTGLTLNKAWVDFRKDANGNNNYNAAVVTCTVTVLEMRIKGDIDLFSCAIMDADVDVSAPIETLDLSGLAHLQTVFCFQNKLKTLNVQGCNELDFLSATILPFDQAVGGLLKKRAKIQMKAWEESDKSVGEFSQHFLRFC